jgi:hypothetical protein
MRLSGGGRGHVDAALASLIANLIDTIVLTPTFNALSTIRGRDETAPFDYREA